MKIKSNEEIKKINFEESFFLFLENFILIIGLCL